MGPPAFDLGKLLANYIITYHAHMLTPENNDLHRLVSYKMIDVCNKTGNYTTSLYVGNVEIFTSSNIGLNEVIDKYTEVHIF